MKLSKLLRAADLNGIALQTDISPEIDGPDAKDTDMQLDPEIKGVFYRSQEVVSGGLFVAIPGYAADGHDYIAHAIAQGAKVVVTQRPVDAQSAVLQVPDTRKALADLSAAFYGWPTRHMTIIGITGTNGKTTTSYLIESILDAAGLKVGVVGTINYRYGGKCWDTPVTTPESSDLQRIMAQMRDAGVTHAVMEVSSHALTLERVRGCEMDIGVFTNLSQDHLDFHNDMNDYWNAKKKLFTDILPASSVMKNPRAVINCRDSRGKELCRTIPLPFLTTGQTAREDVWAERMEFSLSGIEADIHAPIGTVTIQSPLVGAHNLENILNAVGVGLSLDIPFSTIRSGIEALRNVPGRLESVPNTHNRFVYVDYAHTPDALENVLMSLRNLTEDRIICIFGCGGDRDKGKRPLMGAIAAGLSDVALVTSDNPRTESPESIIQEILVGVNRSSKPEGTAQNYISGAWQAGYLVETDRRKAIELGIQGSRPGDTILIAGKGHENYQIVGRSKYHFDDCEEAHNALDKLIA